MHFLNTLHWWNERILIWFKYTFFLGRADYFHYCSITLVLPFLFHKSNIVLNYLSLLMISVTVKLFSLLAFVFVRHTTGFLLVCASKQLALNYSSISFQYTRFSICTYTRHCLVFPPGQTPEDYYRSTIGLRSGLV